MEREVRHLKIPLATTIIVDMQNDFCEGGALAAQDVNSLFIPLNSFLKDTYNQGHHLIYTQDWHPYNHQSFKENGGQWNKHCVENTVGAQLHHKLYLAPEHIRILKGVCPHTEGYSAFDGTRLQILLQQLAVNVVNVVGIATSYCVLQTALDAKKLGLQVRVILPLCRDVSLADTPNALSQMNQAGIGLIKDLV